MTIKQDFLNALTKLKTAGNAVHDWLVKDANSDITAFGLTIPSRSKEIAHIKNAVTTNPILKTDTTFTARAERHYELVMTTSASGDIDISLPKVTRDGDVIRFTPLQWQGSHSYVLKGRVNNAVDLTLSKAQYAGHEIILTSELSSTSWIVNKYPIYADSLNPANLAKSDLSNVTTDDFKTQYDKLGITAGLATQIFTQTSGKFFVRKADGSLPTGIDSSKVWSLADQKTAKGGTAPSGKTHIELPVGDVVFYVAGAGGGGGGYYMGRDGGVGGNTSLGSVITATGGHGGPGDYSGRNGAGRLPRTGKVPSDGVLKNGHGGAGGEGAVHGTDGNEAGNGMYGNLVKATLTLTAGQMYSATIGAGGTEGAGNWYKGAKGENGWIEVEYM